MLLCLGFTFFVGFFFSVVLAFPKELGNIRIKLSLQVHCDPEEHQSIQVT